MSKLKRIVLWLGGAILLAVLAMGIWVGPMIYAAMVGYKIYETTPPVLPVKLDAPAILVFSKTNGFRDDDQIEATNTALVAMAKRKGWSIYLTENAAVFNPEQLKRFQATVWNSVSGDVFTKQQRADFKAWLEQGGGFVALHGSGGDFSYDWKWYRDELIGAKFIGHTLGPHIQQATLNIEDRTHPATRGLGKTWVRADEWYSFANNPRAKGFHILVTIDEASYKPVEQLLPFLEAKDIGMGKDHPLVWWHCVGHGRAFYSALGHTPESYSEPKNVQLIEGAIAWAVGLDGPSCALTGDSAVAKAP